MRFSPATRLADRQTVWVGYANDGTVIDKRHHGHPATIWSAQFSEIFAADVVPCPVSGWVTQQG